MTQVVIGDILPYTQAIATLNQTVFMTNWTANADSDVVVYQTPFANPPNDVTQKLVFPNQYSVAFIGSQQQVQVTLVTPAGAGDIITITRMTPADRMNLYTNTNFVPSMLNNDFGILTLVDQQAQLVDQLIGPRYNYSAVITDVVDTILPILGPNQIWIKNNTNTAIEAFDLITPGGGSVNPGTANQIGYYAADGDAISGVGPLTNGQLLIGSTGLAPVPHTLTAGSGVSITNGAGTITITATGNTGTVTSITQGTGLTFTPSPITTTGTIDLTVPVVVTNGGTGLTSTTVNQLLYSSSNNVIAGLSTVNSAGLLTNVSGVPGWVTATGTGAPVLATSPVLVSPTLGAAIATSLAFNPTTGGIIGTTVADNASAGKVGEFITSTVPTGSAVSLTTATPADVTSITLSAGDWDVWGNVTVLASGANLSNVSMWSSLTSATLPDISLISELTDASVTAYATSVPYLRVNVNALTSVFLSAQATFGSGTAAASGSIFARRVR